MRGKTILITRQHEQSADFVAEIERRGGRAIVVPLIRMTEPDSWAECDRAISDISSYDGIAFTSTNSVVKFMDRCEVQGGDLEQLRALDIFAVGPKTGAAIARKGFAARAIPEQFSAHALAELFKRLELSGKRILLPRSNIGRDELEVGLRNLGAIVDPVVVYKNVEPEEEVLGALRIHLEKGNVDVVTFASPSAVANFCRLFPPEGFSGAGKRVLFAAIGPTTKEALATHGYCVDVVGKEATVRGLVDAITEYFES